MALPVPNMPPSLLGQPPAGASPVAAPTGNPGDNAAGLSEMRAAIDLLAKLLPKLPPNSEQWTAVTSIIKTLGKFAPAGGGDSKVQETTARNLLQDAQRSSMMNMVSGSLGGAGPAAGGSAATPPGTGAMPAAA